MAQGTKCCTCKHFNISQVNCPFYKEKIPSPIFVEQVECQHYEIRITDNNDDLPLAKGR